MLHFRDVTCFGHETSIMQCSKSIFSFSSGILAAGSTSAAGVDCLYDQSGECIQTPAWVNTPGSECNINGKIRLMGSQQPGTGRLEYCYNGYWSPFCKLDPVAASVVCKQLGYTIYSGIKLWLNIYILITLIIIAASIVPTDAFGVVRNFSLFFNINCTGTEIAISHCAIHTTECTPWCPLANIAITCFSKIISIQKCIIVINDCT